MRTAVRVFAVVFSFAAGACGRGTPSPSPAAEATVAAPSTTPSASATGTTAAKGTLAIGERITRPIVPLTEIASNPARYASQVVATSGKVTAVCQAMGCWMEMQDESGQAHIRMHGHQFFVPKTASGHIARVQATIVAHPGATACGNDCEEGAQPTSGHTLAKVELDATGIELD
jgi:hypothetical protein